MRSLRVVGVLALFVALGTAVHCTIDRIPHIYCDSKDDCLAPYDSCDVAHHSCVVGDGGIIEGDGGGVGPDMICTSSDQCADVAPVCAAGRCRTCTSADDNMQCTAHDATTPRCNVPTGRCVACLASADCPKATPVCNVADFTCHKCVAHSECASGVCKADGTCADAATEIAYVNNAAGSGCMDVVHTSTPAMPYCQIQYATMNAARPYILASASTTAYNAINVVAAATTIGPITIVGPAGRGAASTKATVSTAAAPALNLQTTGAAPVTLTVDGLELTGSGAPTTAAGVLCSGGAVAGATITLTIKNSTIVSSGQAGVDSTKCTLTLDANIIASNINDGIKLATTSYTITNNIIAQNGGTTSSPGVEITDAGSTGTFAFNTVASNGGAGTAFGGVTCPNNGAVKVIEESIVAQNAHNPSSNGSQFAGMCMLKNVVTGADSFAGAIQMAPAFVSTSNFHLDVTPGAALTANKNCCIDQVPTIATPNSNHDVDLTTRPKPPGTAWDIGAHEAQ